MKYSLPNRCHKVWLQKADEIKVSFNDKEKMFEYIEEYSNKDFVLSIPKGTELNNEELTAYYEKSENKFTIEFEDIRDSRKLNNPAIPFFWKYAAVSFDELEALKNLGVRQVLIDGVLFFKLPEAKRFNISMRVIPNICHDGYLPRLNSLHCKWIRPQDTELYDKYFDTFEFKTDTITKYQTLFKIYSEDKKWVNNMNILFSNFTESLLAPAFPEEVVEKRINCGQICAQGRCRLCDAALKFGNNVVKEIVSDVLSND